MCRFWLLALIELRPSLSSHFFCPPPLPQLSDRSGDTLAQLISSPLCALRELVLAENFLSDCFIDVMSKDMRKLESVTSSPLRSLDMSSNKIRDR